MEWTVIFTATAAIVCLLSALVAFSNAIRASHERASQARRMRSNELQIESLQISLDSLTVETQRLANSKKMSDVRNATEHLKPKERRGQIVTSSEPDATVDPEAWRAWMNAQLRITARPNQ
jgi:hypothetical protein